jgi:hypothetical protein
MDKIRQAKTKWSTIPNSDKLSGIQTIASIPDHPNLEHILMIQNLD